MAVATSSEGFRRQCSRKSLPTDLIGKENETYSPIFQPYQYI